MTSRTDFPGPALFSYGFRPFFLSATLFALIVVPVWMFAFRGSVSLEGPFAPSDWHVHEMTFGYGSAVLAGFLFTAVPNWTGRMPTRGWPLLLLSVIWLAGRLAVAGLLGLGPTGAMLVDQAFLLAVVAMIAREIVAGRNWRNLKVLVPVTVFWMANLVFHLEAIESGAADHGRRLGIAVLIFLIMLIGGRIVPSFTRNWLAQRGCASVPAPFDRFDTIALATGAVALGLWVAQPFSVAAGALLCAAGILHLVRLVRWRGAAAWRSPLLLMLHLAYLFVPVGLVATGSAAFSILEPAVGAHLLGIGAIGGMTVAVMMRATLGHTGRDLAAGPLLAGAFAMLLAAAVGRAFGTTQVYGSLDALTVSAILWTVAFALVAARLGPWLVAPKVARKTPSRASRSVR
jgi:uncharacterized protein involved in response to NO